MKYVCALLFIPIVLLFPRMPAMGESLRVEDMYPAQYECPGPVEDSEDAARCFTDYFKSRLELLRAQRGTMPSGIEELYQPVTREDVYTGRGSYYIDRDGCGSPYFINGGVIYIDLD
ncbi:MAG: hypothetical protein M0Q23_03310 [Syntrophales bacterium]|nr:hypothetical protein [Syntrophales bacterium]MCK9527673.1 hypothetical protein [Syntrophales bacterium]MDX9921672.1 hypothetical protein [Syntrophales bacterium]